jgi:hypothetical protein
MYQLCSEQDDDDLDWIERILDCLRFNHSKVEHGTLVLAQPFAAIAVTSTRSLPPPERLRQQRRVPYATHEPHTSKVGTYGYLGICGVQIRGSKALKSSTAVAHGNRSSAWRSHA